MDGLALHARPRRWPGVLADAIGLILLVDAAASLLPGHGSIAFVFFHVPQWVPLAPLWPAALAAGILLRVRPLIAAAIVLAGLNTLEYTVLLAAGRVSGSPLAFSAVVAVALVGAMTCRRRAPIWAVAPAAGALLLAHLLTFGATDYRRPADAIVVFGAKAYADGTPSQALCDRTLTGIELYRQGYAGRLVLSGGPGEPQAMRRLALDRGVPAGAIVLDDAGVNTAATLGNLRGRFARVLAVSHYYHNARIKMTARRMGIDCYTVPARETRRLVGEPYYVARECAAFAAYYLRLR